MGEKRMTRLAIASLALVMAAATSSAQADLIPKLGPRIDYPSLASLLSSEDARALLIDVRTAEEYAEGHIPGAILIPYDEIGARFSEPDKARPIVVYCHSGRRSAIAASTLKDMGYANVSDFGAVSDWQGDLRKGNEP